MDNTNEKPNEQQAIYEEVQARYKSILAGMQVDQGFADVLTNAEIKGDSEAASRMLKALADSKVTLAALEASRRQEEPALSPAEQEIARIRAEIESIMLSDWRGSSPAAEPAEEQATDPLRQQIEDIMLNGRDSRGYMERSKRQRQPLVHGVRT